MKALEDTDRVSKKFNQQLKPRVQGIFENIAYKFL